MWNFQNIWGNFVVLWLFMSGVSNMYFTMSCIHCLKTKVLFIHCLLCFPITFITLYLIRKSGCTGGRQHAVSFFTVNLVDAEFFFQILNVYVVFIPKTDELLYCSLKKKKDWNYFHYNLSQKHLFQAKK